MYGFVERTCYEHGRAAGILQDMLPVRPEWGSVVSAWVVVRKGSLVPSLEMLRHHVKETLASYCAPRRLTIVDELQRSALGKVLTNELLPMS